MQKYLDNNKIDTMQHRIEVKQGINRKIETGPVVVQSIVLLNTRYKILMARYEM